MKANPKKLGGRKGDRLTPDWLDGYVVVELTDHQVVLHNTKTNKLLKSISVAHIKTFQHRAADGKVKDEEVDSLDDEMQDEIGEVEGFGGEVKDVGSDVKGVGDEVEDVGGSKTAQKFDDEVERLKKLSIGGVALCEPFLDFSPAKLTAKDTWSIIPPQEIPTPQFEMLKNVLSDFMPIWAI